MKNNQKSINNQIFEEDSLSSQQKQSSRQYAKKSQSDQEEGEIVSKSQQPNISEEFDSSQQDESKIERERKKRQVMWRHRNQQDQKMANYTEEDIKNKAFSDLQKTNKRVMLMRKKNEKRMEDIEKLRMTHQPYLITSNTHYRGSSSEYPIITHDMTGKAFYYPNYSLKVPEMRLDHFIQKNIKQESSANYLNEVVKFENYAYQQRKKRRHNFE